MSTSFKMPPSGVQREAPEISKCAGSKPRRYTSDAERLHLTGSFGSKRYAFEELIAEISAAYLCASLGITPTVRLADYIGSWL